MTASCGAAVAAWRLTGALQSVKLPPMNAGLQEVADRLTFDMYVDCDLDAKEAARQLGITRQTVKRRVRRATLRYGGGNRYNSALRKRAAV